MAVVHGLRGSQGRCDVAYHAETVLEGPTWIRDLGDGSDAELYYCWWLDLQFNTPVSDCYVSEARQGWDDSLPGKVVCGY